MLVDGCQCDSGFVVCVESSIDLGSMVGMAGKFIAMHAARSYVCGMGPQEHELPMDSGIPWCCAIYRIDRSLFFVACIPMARMAVCNVGQGRGASAGLSKKLVLTQLLFAQILFRERPRRPRAAW